MVSRVLDSTSFYAGIPFASQEKSFTTSLVYEEIKHIKKRYNAVNILVELGRLQIIDPQKRFVDKAVEKASQTGDLADLSDEDLSIIGLSLEIGGDLVTDDFAVSNVAKQLGIKVIPIMTKGISKILQQSSYCIVCRQEYEGVVRCPLCGTLLKKKSVKSKSSSNSVLK